jgi:5S rRNA maturation endonuclease (ribonuclease M5)
MTQTMTTGTTDLVDILHELGVDVRRTNGQEISGCCPVHEKRTGRADNSPSWSMNATSGLWICHSCGARGTLAGLVSELTGDTDSINAVNQLLLETGLNRLTMPERVEYKPEVDWLTYSRFEQPPTRVLVSRNIDPDVALAHGIKWNVLKKAWIIPIVSPFGELLGWQEKGKDWFKNEPAGVKKSVTLFGIERFQARTAVLVESPLDVVRFASAFNGMQALATFGAHVSKEQMNILASSAERVIVAMDNDKAGIESGKYLFKNLPRFRGGIFWLNYSKTEAKDIGDMTDDEVQHAVTEASVIPWWLA